TTYVAEALYASIPRGTPPPSADTATRTGSFTLLIYALVSLAAGTFIPYLTTLADSFPSLPSRVGPVGRLVLSELTPRNMWTFALAWYAACMVATFWATSVRGATAVVALVGVPWAITCWVPFALVKESIREVCGAMGHARGGGVLAHLLASSSFKAASASAATTGFAHSHDEVGRVVNTSGGGVLAHFLASSSFKAATSFAGEQAAEEHAGQDAAAL
ncbi:uncharacterized protein RHOBADRAFT_47293, partial [Rhodotorula graminis WP1]